MNILIACEESQRVCIAFREKGHNAFSCDIQECSGGHPEWHIKDEVDNYLYGHCAFYTQDGTFNFIPQLWDMIIAFPPCTFITKAGARHLYKNKTLQEDRYKKGLAAKAFFLKILNAPCEKICIENPTPLKIFNLPKESQVIQPYQFDENNEHPFTKRTLLWTKGLPQLIPTTPTNMPLDSYIPSNTSKHKKGGKGSKGIARSSTDRSKTFKGIARAMAEQWG